jgi:hypothetical protein
MRDPSGVSLAVQTGHLLGIFTVEPELAANEA